MKCLCPGRTLATKAKVNGPFIRGGKYDPVSLFALMINRKGLGIFQNHVVKRQGWFQVISIV
jgi:hypothetical protein